MYFQGCVSAARTGQRIWSKIQISCNYLIMYCKKDKNMFHLFIHFYLISRYFKLVYIYCFVTYQTINEPSQYKTVKIICSYFRVS